jgi:hypothetical protein
LRRSASYRARRKRKHRSEAYRRRQYERHKARLQAARQSDPTWIARRVAVERHKVEAKNRSRTHELRKAVWDFRRRWKFICDFEAKIKRNQERYGDPEKCFHHWERIYSRKRELRRDKHRSGRQWTAFLQALTEMKFIDDIPRSALWFWLPPNYRRQRQLKIKALRELGWTPFNNKYQIKISENDVRRIRELAAHTHLSAVAIGRMYGISADQVQNIAYRACWAYVQ